MTCDVETSIVKMHDSSIVERTAKLGNCPVCNQPLPSGDNHLKCGHCQSELKNINGQWSIAVMKGRFYAIYQLLAVIITVAVIFVKFKIIQNQYVSVAIVFLMALGFFLYLYEGLSGGVIRLKGAVIIARSNPIGFAIAIALNLCFVLLFIWVGVSVFM